MGHEAQTDREVAAADEPTRPLSPSEGDITARSLHGAGHTAIGAHADEGPDRVGSRIERYVVLRELGQGGMGVVYAAYDGELDRQVALKLVRRARASGQHVARMRREAQAMAQLSHPNVVQVFNTGMHDGELFVAMELIAGATLRAWTERRAPGWRGLLDVFTQAAKIWTP